MELNRPAYVRSLVRVCMRAFALARASMNDSLVRACACACA